MSELVSYAVGFIYIPEKLGFIILLLCSLMMCTNNRIHINIMVADVLATQGARASATMILTKIIVRWSYSFVSSLSSLRRHVWQYWFSKMLVTYILSKVCLRFNQLSLLFVMHFMGLYVFKLPTFPPVIVRIRVPIILPSSNRMHEPFAMDKV